MEKRALDAMLATAAESFLFPVNGVAEIKGTFRSFRHLFFFIEQNRIAASSLLFPLQFPYCLSLPCHRRKNHRILLLVFRWSNPVFFLPPLFPTQFDATTTREICGMYVVACCSFLLSLFWYGQTPNDLIYTYAVNIRKFSLFLSSSSLFNFANATPRHQKNALSLFLIEFFSLFSPHFTGRTYTHCRGGRGVVDGKKHHYYSKRHYFRLELRGEGGGKQW